MTPPEVVEAQKRLRRIPPGDAPPGLAEAVLSAARAAAMHREAAEMRAHAQQGMEAAVASSDLSLALGAATVLAGIERIFPMLPSPTLEPSLERLLSKLERRPGPPLPARLI